MPLLSAIYLQVEGGAEHATETVNPILPAMNEIVWGALSFLVLLFLMVKWGFPAVKKGMDARAERIRASLAEAEKTREEASSILDEYKSQLADAKGQAARIIESARQDADKVRQDLRHQAEQEVADLRQRALADINAHVERVKAGLQADVARLSIELAEKVVERSLDKDTNMRLIETFIEQANRQPAN